MISTYKYAVVRADVVFGMFKKPAPQDSFVSRDTETEAVENLLAQGYRWVRTDGDMAIFEKPIIKVD